MSKEILIKRMLHELAPKLREWEQHNNSLIIDLNEEFTPYQKVISTLGYYIKIADNAGYEEFLFDKKLVWKFLKQEGLEDIAPMLDKFIFCGEKEPKVWSFRIKSSTLNKFLGWTFLIFAIIDSIGFALGLVDLSLVLLQFVISIQAFTIASLEKANESE